MDGKMETNNLPEPGSPKAAKAIRKAALKVVAALDELAPLTAPYRGYGDVKEPPGMDVDHFNAYHQSDLEGYDVGYGQSLYSAIRTDLLNQVNDGFDWLEKEEEEVYVVDL
jgi:hypothetical protein